VILRSKSPKGPFIPYDKNPILTQRHLDPKRPRPITSAGHAELVDGPDGKTYAIFLAVRPYEGDYYNTGRETFIAPVTWTDGWPTINPGIEEIQYAYKADFKEVKQPGARPQSGTFKYRLNFDRKLDPALLFLRTHDPSWYTLGKKQGLTMKLLPETVMGLGHPAFIGKRQQHLYASASTVLDFKATNANEQAGILIFQNEKHFYYLCKSMVNNQAVVQLFRGPGKGEKQELIAEQELANASSPLHLRIDAKGDKYNFLFAEKAGDWRILKDSVDGKFISTKEAGGFIGALFALYASSNGEMSTSHSSFKWLDYEGH
jgi:xylan 1,4-beta-xylosidase